MLDRLTRTHPTAWPAETLIWLFFATLTASLLAPEWLLTPTTATGGDLVSHRLYAHTLIHDALPHGRLTTWMPEVFGGFPLFGYYFPLPFLTMAALHPITGEAIAFKLGAVLPALLLPGVVYSTGRRMLRLPFPSALLGATGAWIVLTHEQNAIWGGNLLALLAGEFAYAYGFLLAVPALGAWARLARTLADGQPAGRALTLAVVLEALTGLAHGYALLAVGFGSLTLLLIVRPPRRLAVWLAAGHTLAFCTLGAWLWPLLEMHAYTTPNDSLTWLDHWLDPIAPTLRWWFIGASAAGGLWLLFRRRLTPLTRNESLPLALLIGAALWSLAGWWLAGRLGLADLRCLPLALLFLAVAAGWSMGALLQRAPTAGTPDAPPTALQRRRAQLWALALTALMIGEVAGAIQKTPQWAQWNFQGAEHKPLWRILSGLFPQMRGDLFDPRLIFEHDPENNALGSTRALEALPLELGGRPVLEGLYMESALLAPVIYLTQAEISRAPSSPLARFPSARPAPGRAAVHLRMLYADTLLVRSPEMRRLLAADPAFERVAVIEPFELWRLRDFSTPLIEPLTVPLHVLPRTDWQRHAFDWFAALADAPPAFWPVYDDDDRVASPSEQQPTVIRAIRLERARIRFTTSTPGQPVLIRQAFHPRWRLQTPGSLHLAAPGFLLVIPADEQVELIFGDTPIGQAGSLATLAALLVLAVLWWRGGCIAGSGGTQEVSAQDLHKRPEPLLHIAPVRVLLLLIGLAAAILAGRTSPEATYRLAWQAFNTGDSARAAELFAQAANERQGHGRRQEALYWRAIALERAGDRNQARALFTEIALAPAGHWPADALQALLRDARERGDTAAVERWEARLRTVAPLVSQEN